MSQDNGYSPITSNSNTTQQQQQPSSSLLPVDNEDVNDTNQFKENAHLERSNKKLLAVISLFLISLFAFVSQTELTSYLYNSLDFDQPYLLLYLTHGSWWMIWPVQVLCIAIFKHIKRSKKLNYHVLDYQRLQRNIKHSLKNQHKNIFKTSGIVANGDNYIDYEYPDSMKDFIFSVPIKSITIKIFIITGILSIAGCTWYVGMGIAPASDITAIYNCSAFSALVFAIPILHEKFSYLKLSSVLLAVLGVFFVAYSGESDHDGDDSSSKEFPLRVLGDLIIAIGAVLYGLYEVLYKKLCCPPINSVSSRRQVAFSNFCASLIGLATISTLWMIIIIAHVFGLSKFHLPTSGLSWLIIIASLLSNLIYSLSFLALMSLTSPVLSSVSSLITILFVGLFEWLLFGVKLSAGQLIGDLFVVIGFGVLSYSYWAEITEEDVDDEEDYDPTDTEQ